jgi:hypothetical protein
MASDVLMDPYDLERRSSMSTASSKRNKIAQLQTENTLVTQLPTVLPNGTFLVKGAKMTSVQIAATLKQHSDAITLANSLHDQWHAAVVAADALKATANASITAVRDYVVVTYGETSSQFSTLGFKPRKPRKVKTLVKADAIKKTIATRGARHTMGSRQKASIHGTPPVATSSTTSGTGSSGH